MTATQLLRHLALACALLHSLVALADGSDTDAISQSRLGIEALIVKAERGHGEAQADLAERYATGYDVPQDFEQAAIWRQRAADQEIPRAMNALGKQYAAGLGLTQDKEKALSLLQRAAREHNPDFWFDLAVLYEQIGGDEALQEAAAWHIRAVESGHVAAHAHLGLFYYNGTGVEQDLQRAAQLLGYAAERGHSRAQNNLGLMLSQGQGVAQDYEKAVTLFQSAADQGLKQAYTNLAVMYENGFGVKVDEDRAVGLYRQASLQGSLKGALEQIGFLADPRINIKVTSTDDLRQLLRQAQLGDAIAQFQGAYLLLGLNDGTANYTVSAELFAKAAENGISTAMSDLGILYFHGLGVPQDYVLGFMWVSLGAISGRNELITIRDRLAGYLTAAQINEAQDRVRKYLANRRAEIQ